MQQAARKGIAVAFQQKNKSFDMDLQHEQKESQLFGRSSRGFEQKVGSRSREIRPFETKSTPAEGNYNT